MVEAQNSYLYST